MSEIEIVTPVVQEGIEFYCSKSGEEVGMSQSGLALFCGIAESTIRDLLKQLRGNTPPKSLEHLTGKFIDLTITSAQNAKVIDGDVCEEIVWYYASERRNVVAQTNHRKFAKNGVKSFIQQITGFQKQTTDVNTVLLQEILGTMKQMKTKTEVLDKFNKATITLPGLQYQFKEYAHGDRELDGSPFGATQWLKSKGINFTHGQKVKFGRMVAELYKCNRQQQPEKKSNYGMGIKKFGRTTAYRPSDIPMLETALAKMLSLPIIN